jgi:arylsulfatase A-like enzyme
MKVLVLHASALHLGFLGCYGNAWVETPNLDRLAAEGVVFDQHFADCVGAELALPEGFGNDNISFASVRAPAFQSVSDATPLELALEAVVAALDTVADRPRWLCWAELPSLYPPWILPAAYATRYLTPDPGEEEDEEPFEPLRKPALGPLDPDDLVLWERIRCTYAGAVTYLDAGVGLLVEELKQRGLIEDLLLIVTSSRGLSLGEHGVVGDVQPRPHEEVAHVPLIVRQPHGPDAGRRIAALTQPGDLMATLADGFGVQQPLTEGRSLLPLMRGEVEKVRDYTISNWAMADAEEWALRTPEWTLLLPTKPEGRAVQLFAKPEDRWELNDVIQHHLELAEELEHFLRGVAATRSEAQGSASTH